MRSEGGETDTSGMYEGAFTGYDGHRLFERRWVPAGYPRAAVVIVHGYGHHSGSFAHVAEYLRHADFGVYAFDQYGFGLAKGPRGRIPSFDAAVSDLHAYLIHIGGEIGREPLFLLGHSYGALVLLHYIAAHHPDVTGLVFSSPMMKLDDSVTPAKQRAVKMAARFAPWFPVARVDIEAISREPGFAQNARNDHLCYYGPIRARTACEMAQACAAAASAARAVTTPVLIMHGTGDRIADPKGAQLLHDAAPSTDKTLKYYQGAYHELFNDSEKEAFLADLVTWLDRHTP